MFVVSGLIALISIYYILRPFVEYEAMKAEERRIRKSATRKEEL